jgi:hypothetical protein
MTMPPLVSRLLLASAVATIVACSDDGLGDPQRENLVDTVTVGSLTGTPVTTASGFAVENGAVRTDQTTGFDFAYNIEADGRRVFLPRAVLGLPSTTTADPGLMRREEQFDEIRVAPSNGYVTDEVVPVEVGERYIVRSRVICSQTLPYYAKLEIIGFEDSLVHLKVLANTNCGFKGLEPGLPDR